MSIYIFLTKISPDLLDVLFFSCQYEWVLLFIVSKWYAFWLRCTQKKSAPVKVGADSEYGVVYGLTDNNLLAVYDVDTLLKLVQFFCIRIAKNAYAIDTINIE